MKNRERPAVITDDHVSRKAKVYVRQSTEEQVQENTGSTDYQRAQRSYPEKWGWADDLIEVIEDDLGLSGSAVAHRKGYMRMVAEIEAGEVGLVCVSDLTRIGRDAFELLRLANSMRLHNVLLAVDGRTSDFANGSDFLSTRLIATVAEHENLMRREHMQRRGRHAKAAKGQAVSQPPCGYVREKDGSWIKDPDLLVQAAVEAVLSIFLRERSCQRTAVELKRLGIMLPRRTRRWGVRWVEPDVPGAYRIVTNPAYAGSYVFRRHVSDLRCGRDKRGRNSIRQRKALPHETITIESHHESYATPDEWSEIQAILQSNAPSKERRNPGNGSALAACRTWRIRASCNEISTDGLSSGVGISL